MNFLNDYPKVRKWLYFVQWVVNGILAILAAYFAATGVAVADLPAWYVVTLAVAPVVWTYTGLQAGANTPVDSPPPAYEGGYALLGALGVGLIVLTILLLVLTLLKVVAISYVVLVVLFVIGVVLVLVDGRRVL